jgi:hypothetical protein
MKSETLHFGPRELARLSKLPQIQGKKLLRYIEICAAASDAVDAVRSASPQGFKFSKSNGPKSIQNDRVLKI